jgi:hypothetical protein
VNRRDRRAAASRARRGHRPGYTHRLLAGLGNGMPLKAGVHHVAIEHDHWCAIYRGGDCNCVPDISVSHPGDDVTVIDECGQARRMRKQ